MTKKLEIKQCYCLKRSAQATETCAFTGRARKQSVRRSESYFLPAARVRIRTASQPGPLTLRCVWAKFRNTNFRKARTDFADRFWGPPGLESNGYRGFFLGVKAAGAWN
jgi:hypothetical protein